MLRPQTMALVVASGAASLNCNHDYRLHIYCYHRTANSPHLQVAGPLARYLNIHPASSQDFVQPITSGEDQPHDAYFIDHNVGAR